MLDPEIRRDIEEGAGGGGGGRETGNGKRSRRCRVKPSYSFGCRRLRAATVPAQGVERSTIQAAYVSRISRAIRQRRYFPGHSESRHAAAVVDLVLSLIFDVVVRRADGAFGTPQNPMRHRVRYLTAVNLACVFR